MAKKRLTPKEKQHLRKLAEEHLCTEESAEFGGKLRQAVFGFNDGLVSTFAVVAGVAGAMLGSRVIILTGLANLVAGAFSMGLGSYLSLKSENEYYDKQLVDEQKEIETKPDIEREEVRIIYMKKGFSGKLLDKMVDKITSNKQLWLDVMMKEEFGLSRNACAEPRLLGLIMSGAFVIGSIIPILPYFFFPLNGEALKITIAFSLIGLFLAGVIKSFFTKEHWLKVGLEMVAIGAVSAGATYFIGQWFAGWM